MPACRRRDWGRTVAGRIAGQRPDLAHGMTKTMLNQEWSMTIEQAIEAEAQAQAICMQTQGFSSRAYHAFARSARRGTTRVLGERRNAVFPLWERGERGNDASRPVAFVTLPFFDDVHRQLGAASRRASATAPRIDETDDRAPVRAWVRLGDAGFLRWCVPPSAWCAGALDSRCAGGPARNAGLYLAAGGLCVRDAGLGSGAITLAGTDGQTASLYLGAVANGRKIAALRSEEPGAGSDAGRSRPRCVKTLLMVGCSAARRPGSATAGIADFTCAVC